MAGGRKGELRGGPRVVLGVREPGDRDGERAQLRLGLIAHESDLHGEPFAREREHTSELVDEPFQVGDDLFRAPGRVGAVADEHLPDATLARRGERSADLTA